MSSLQRLLHQTAADSTSERGYYGVPVIHGPHWKWLIIGYFYLGGISGASAVIASFARIFSISSHQSVARTATYLSFCALLPCPLLLILDLGRPGRFLNMLRVFKTSSPMSVGTWGLSLFGVISCLSTFLQIADDLARKSQRHPADSATIFRRGLSILAAISGFFVAGYTGILLSATAVPLWSKRPALLAPLFLSSAMTSGAAAITAVAALLDSEGGSDDETLRTLETIAAVAEGSLLVGWVTSLGPTAGPITSGRLGMLLRHAVVGGVAMPLLISASLNRLPLIMRRPATLVASGLTLGGVFALRFAIVEGGRISANDPDATFEMTG